MIIFFPSLKFLVQDFFPELQKKRTHHQTKGNKEQCFPGLAIPEG